MSRVAYALGGGLLRPAARHIDLGPDHPSRAGLIEIEVDAVDGIVRSAEVRIGAIHRSVEKLLEVRDYRQLLSLANRHDWHASFVGELGAALTIEAALGLEPPPRATVIRSLAAEVARVTSHLAFLTAVPAVLVPDPATATVLRSARESLRTVWTTFTGNRVHPMVVRLGGLACDVDAAWLTSTVRAAEAAASVAADVAGLLADDALPTVAGADLGLVKAYGVTGPAARAAGLDLDLRRLDPYLSYAGHDVALPVGGRGDAVGRIRQWAAEVRATVPLIGALADEAAHTPGPVSVKLPKVVRVPEGETYVATESPLGHAGWYLLSRGDKVPWRLKLRTPSFANLALLEAVLPGTPIDSIPLAVASLGYVVGDAAK